MKIYIDKEYRCHTVNDGTMREVETSLFDGKCAEYIEGYCYDDSRGYVTVFPYKPYFELDTVQREYERTLIAEYEALINELYAEVIS